MHGRRLCPLIASLSYASVNTPAGDGSGFDAGVAALAKGVAAAAPEGLLAPDCSSAAFAADVRALVVKKADGSVRSHGQLVAQVSKLAAEAGEYGMARSGVRHGVRRVVRQGCRMSLYLCKTRGRGIL